MEVEARAAQKASIAREGVLLLGLREADSPWLRGLLSALEVTWSQHTSDLAKAQGRLQQVLPIKSFIKRLVGLSQFQDQLKKDTNTKNLCISNQIMR